MGVLSVLGVGLAPGATKKRNNATGPGAVGTCAQIKHLTCKGVLLYVDRPPEAINQIKALLCVKGALVALRPRHTKQASVTC